MSLANVSIVGNLVRMPEQMCFASGKVKTTFTVAVNGFGKPNRGGDSADFYRVETWGKLAELAGKYLEKGNQIAVSGRLLFDRFVDQQGKNRVVPVVEANQLSLPPKPRSKNADDNNDFQSSADSPIDTVVPMSGHLVLEADEQLALADEIESQNQDTNKLCNDNICSADEFKVVTMEEKTKSRGRKQAVS